MSKLLTDGADETAERIVPWAICGSLVFVAYALAQHIGWRDAAACTIVFWLVSRSIRLAGRPS